MPELSRGIFGGRVDETETIGIDELARRCGTTVRTIREYQTLGLLPAPGKAGRVATYDARHVGRLETIGRLQARGYSLAAIGDLLSAWQAGSTLPSVLGLPTDAVGALDEMPVLVMTEELARDLPALFGTGAATRAAEDAGLVGADHDGRRAVRSPALVQLVADIVASGRSLDEALTIVAAIHRASEGIADAAVAVLLRGADGPPLADPDAAIAMLRRARSLLAQGVATMAIAHIGDRLSRMASEGRDDVAAVIELLRIGAVRDASR
jgi:DNA-binding transcriptional MerR regulator